MGEKQDNNLSIKKKKKAAGFIFYVQVFAGKSGHLSKKYPFCQTFTGITLFPQNI